MVYWIFFLSETARGDGPESCVEYVGDRQLEIARAGYHLLPPPLKRALPVPYSGEEKNSLYTVLSFFSCYGLLGAVSSILFVMGSRAVSLMVGCIHFFRWVVNNASPRVRASCVPAYRVPYLHAPPTSWHSQQPLKRALFVPYSGEEKNNLYTVLSFFWRREK